MEIIQSLVDFLNGIVTSFEQIMTLLTDLVARVENLFGSSEEA